MTDLAQRAVGRVASLPLAGLVVAFTLAQLLDLGSALVVARELNPIAASIVVRPLLARVVLMVGIVAGLFGALSNTHLTPFLTS